MLNRIEERKALERRLYDYYRKTAQEEKNKTPFRHNHYPRRPSVPYEEEREYNRLKKEEMEKMQESKDIRLIIDLFTLWLYKNNYTFKHMPIQRTVSFCPKNRWKGYEYLSYNKKGWFHYGSHGGCGMSIEFFPVDFNDLINKLVRYRLIENKGVF